MNNYKIVKYTSNFYEVWNNFIQDAKNATFLFHRDFLEYHAHKFKDHSLMIFKDDKLVAVLPANINEGKLHSHQGLTYGGLIYNASLKFQSVLHIFQDVLQFLHSNNVTSVFIKLLPSCYTKVPNDELEYLMYVLQAKLTNRMFFSVINLKEEVKFSRDRKAGAKRGKKSDLKIINDDDFDVFWNKILIPNLLEKHQSAPVHSLNDIKLLKSKFPNKIKQFNVYKSGSIVAGATLFLCNNIVRCQYISGNKQSNALGSLDLLFDELLNREYRNKSFFDLGASTKANNKLINKGLLYWKEGLGARSVSQDFYQIETDNYKFLNDVLL